MNTDTSPGEELSFEERMHQHTIGGRNRFITAAIRQTLLYKKLTAMLAAKKLTPEQMAELGRLLAVAGGAGLNLDIDRELSGEEMQAFAAELESALSAGILEPNLDPGRDISAEEMREFMRDMTAGMAVRSFPRPGTAKVKVKSGGRWTEHTPAYEGAGIEDFVMGLLVKLLASQPDFLLPEYGQNADAWHRSVVLNAMRDAAKGQNRHDRILRHAALMPGSWLSGGRVSGWYGRSAEQVVMERLDHLENLDRIGRLPKSLRHAAHLRYEGYSQAEIGRTLGISENAVKMRLRKIRSPRVCKALGIEPPADRKPRGL